jgi:hypothetical protein
LSQARLSFFSPVRAGAAASKDEHLLLDHDRGYAPGWLDGQAQLFLGAVRAAESE